MKYFFLFLAAVSIASAQVPAPDYFRFMQWDSMTNLQNRTVAVPASPGHGFFIFHPLTRRPYCSPPGDIFYDTTTDSVKVSSSLFTPYATTASLAGYVATSDFTWTNLGGKPTLFSGSYADLTGKPTLFSGAYSDLTGKPSLFDGQYSSLTGIPSTFIPSAHTHAQNDVTGLVAALAGKEPTISTGTTGQYWRGDKTWQTLPAQVQPDWNAVSGLGQILNKPTIPAAQVQSDWNAVSGSGVILNKPTIPVLNNGTVIAALGFTPVSQAGARGAITLTTTGSGSASYNGTSGVLNIPTPASSKRQEAYSGVTNASGIYTVTFGTAFAATPNIQAGLINGADNQNLRVTAISTTGFTVLARNRVDVIGLLPTWTNVSGITVHVLITEP